MTEEAGITFTTWEIEVVHFDKDGNIKNVYKEEVESGKGL